MLSHGLHVADCNSCTLCYKYLTSPQASARLAFRLKQGEVRGCTEHQLHASA